jgi:hypothetical protein
MRLFWVTVIALFFAIASCPPCRAADPIFLLLKALAPIPLKLTGPGPSYQLYQNRVADPSVEPNVDPLAKPASKKHAPIVDRFLYDTQKFDDLGARFQLYQDAREANGSLQLQNAFDEQAATGSMTKVMNEYFRRVYQGYSISLNGPAGQNGAGQDMNVLNLGRNLIASYQPFHLFDELEARLHYDAIGHSTHLMLVSSVVEFEGTYYSIDEKSPAAIPESVVWIDDAMDQFARYERFSLSLAHTFKDLGLRLKGRYCALSGTLDYGFSKALGPLALQIVREENHFGDMPDSLAVQLTFTARL